MSVGIPPVSPEGFILKIIHQILVHVEFSALAFKLQEFLPFYNPDHRLSLFMSDRPFS